MQPGNFPGFFLSPYFPGKNWRPHLVFCDATDATRRLFTTKKLHHRSRFAILVSQSFVQATPSVNTNPGRVSLTVFSTPPSAFLKTLQKKRGYGFSKNPQWAWEHWIGKNFSIVAVFEIRQERKLSFFYRSALWNSTLPKYLVLLIDACIFGSQLSQSSGWTDCDCGGYISLNISYFISSF